MEEIIDHEGFKNEILRVLNENRKDFLTVHKIINEMDDNFYLKSREAEPYLFELCNAKMVSKITRKNEDDKYHITDIGINYASSNYSIKPASGASQIADAIYKLNDSFLFLANEIKLTAEEQTKQNELLIELQKALYDEKSKDDGKARNILKKGLDAGKSIALPLIIEYLKSELKSKGILL